jgi:hypothetical protein
MRQLAEVGGKGEVRNELAKIPHAKMEARARFSESGLCFFWGCVRILPLNMHDSR